MHTLGNSVVGNGGGCYKINEEVTWLDVCFRKLNSDHGPRGRIDGGVDWRWGD